MCRRNAPSRTVSGSGSRKVKGTLTGSNRNRLDPKPSFGDRWMANVDHGGGSQKFQSQRSRFRRCVEMYLARRGNYRVSCQVPATPAGSEVKLPFMAFALDNAPVRTEVLPLATNSMVTLLPFLVPVKG